MGRGGFGGGKSGGPFGYVALGFMVGIVTGVYVSQNYRIPDVRWWMVELFRTTRRMVGNGGRVEVVEPVLEPPVRRRRWWGRSSRRQVGADGGEGSRW